jgi:hypothetical protein
VVGFSPVARARLADLLLVLHIVVFLAEWPL